MYTLHIGSKHISSWSLRPWLLMKVLLIPFAETVHHFIADKAEQRRRWRAFSPNSQVPALDDGGRTVWDSLTIAEYLAERHPQVWPQDAAARAWARCAAAEMHSGFPVLRTVCNFTLEPAAPPATTKVCPPPLNPYNDARKSRGTAASPIASILEKEYP